MQVPHQKCDCRQKKTDTQCIAYSSTKQQRQCRQYNKLISGRFVHLCVCNQLITQCVHVTHSVPVQGHINVLYLIKVIRISLQGVVYVTSGLASSFSWTVWWRESLKVAISLTCL